MPDRRLVPGMFANVRHRFRRGRRDQITLPQTAITYNPYGDTVFSCSTTAVDDKGKPHLTVQQRFVKLGATRGDQVAVQSGVKPGEVVVSRRPNEAAQRHGGDHQQRRAADERPESDAAERIAASAT